MTVALAGAADGKYGAGRFPFGTCHEPGCERAACHRFTDEDGERLVCRGHLPEHVIFAPFLGQQEKLFEADHRWVLGGGGAGGSKALALDTPIPTPTGWTTMGELRVGDAVFDERGKPCTVTAKSEVFRDHECFRVTFDDGEQIVADAGHRWLTYDYDERRSLLRQERRERKESSPHYVDQREKRNQPQVRTTREIFASQTNHGRVNHAIPTNAPLECPEAELPIKPYVLGAWLGDGTSSSTGFTCDEREPFIVEEMGREGVEVRRWPSGANAWGLVGYTRRLRELGVLDNKHIPVAYLRASYSQRLALLQGIVDTDGCVHATRSRVVITQVNQRLARDIHELACSLGLKPTLREGRAYLNGEDYGPVWTVQFTTSMPVARMPRKLARIKPVANRTQRWRYITNVEPVATVPVQCISVDSPSHLYLAGRSMVPAHNTYAGARLWLKQWQAAQAHYEENPSYQSKGWALFLRRTMPELLQVIADFKSYFKRIDDGALWNEQQKIATFPNGFRVQFGGVENTDDWQKYWGNAYTLLVLDEATLFEFVQFDKLDQRVRTDDVVLEGREQTYLLTNPIGAEMKQYLKRRFVKPAPPETDMVVRTQLADGRIVEKKQIYIPFNLYDNPAYAESGDYEASLRTRSSAVQRALLANDWDVDEGAWVGDDWDPTIHVCDPFPIPESWAKFKCGDYGYSARSSILWFAVDPEGNKVCYRSLSVRGKTVEELGYLIREIEMAPLVANGIRITGPEWDEFNDCTTVYGPMDSALWSKQGETGPSRGEVLSNIGCGFFKSNKNPDSAAEQIRQHLRRRTPNAKGDKVIPALRFFRTCKTRLRLSDGSYDETGPIITIPTCPPDEANPDRWDTHADDHDLDALGYGLLSRPLAGSGEDAEDKGQAVVIDLIRMRAEREKKAAFPSYYSSRTR